MTTTMNVEAQQRAAAPVFWGRALVAGAIVALSFSIPIPSTQATETPAPLLARAHEQLARLLSSRESGVTETREMLIEMQLSTRQIATRLRLMHPALAITLKRQVDDALAQVDGDDTLLLSDRAEFEVSYLIPIAQTLIEVNDVLGGAAR